MTEPVWLRDDVIRAVHQRQLSEHGGQDGIRDEGLLASALSRPRNLHVYRNPPATLFHLAAAYAFGIARNHPFVDGNKRVAYVATILFLRLNGWLIAATDAEKYDSFIALAAGDLSEDELATWLEAKSRPN